MADYPDIPRLSENERLIRALMSYNPQYDINNGVSVDGSGQLSGGILSGGSRVTAGIPLTNNLSLTGALFGGGAYGTTPDNYKVRATSPLERYIGLRYKVDF